jgi:hypothetical protein
MAFRAFYSCFERSQLSPHLVHPRSLVCCPSLLLALLLVQVVLVQQQLLMMSLWWLQQPWRVWRLRSCSSWGRRGAVGKRVKAVERRGAP